MKTNKLKTIGHVFSQIAISCLLIAVVGCASTTKQEGTGEYVDNSAITAKVKAQFLADPQIKSLPITVNTYKGVVQLSGFVDSAQQATRATNLAAQVAGVKQIQNDLVVR